MTFVLLGSQKSMPEGLRFVPSRGAQRAPTVILEGVSKKRRPKDLSAPHP